VAERVLRRAGAHSAGGAAERDSRETTPPPHPR
jgi:hypothetical protein